MGRYNKKVFSLGNHYNNGSHWTPRCTQRHSRRRFWSFCARGVWAIFGKLDKNRVHEFRIYRHKPRGPSVKMDIKVTQEVVVHTFFLSDRYFDRISWRVHGRRNWNRNDCAPKLAAILKRFGGKHLREGNSIYVKAIPGKIRS